jgi:hypothetical protein
VTIRLHGTQDECHVVAEQLDDVFDVVAISDPVPDRGRSRLVRVYVEIRLTSAQRRQEARPDAG